MISPVIDPMNWNTDDYEPIGPPPLKRQPGRPTKNKRRDEGEVELGKKRRGQLGYNVGIAST